MAWWLHCLIATIIITMIVIILLTIFRHPSHVMVSNP